ncbi:MAG: phosphatase PAP2 family protein [Candidatus Cryosericum sp.]
MRKQASFITNRAFQWLQNPWPFAALVSTALVYVAFLASGLAEQILDNESIVHIDGWLVRWLAARRTPFGIGFFEAVSFVGNWEVAILVIVAALIFLWNRRRRTALTLALACAGSELVVYFGKAGFGRPRPPAIFSVVTELDGSFPSGHANISVALYALGFYLLFRASRPSGLRKVWLALAFLFPLLIGFSRLYLGAHYLSDVLAGWGVGLWWSILVLGVFGFIRRRRSAKFQTADVRSHPSTAK